LVEGLDADIFPEFQLSKGVAPCLKDYPAVCIDSSAGMVILERCAAFFMWAALIFAEAAIEQLNFQIVGPSPSGDKKLCILVLHIGTFQRGLKRRL
jgi:hypothetical protein